MNKYALVLLIFLSLITSNVFSYNLRQISNRDGLSNSSVTCLFQDSKRFLWIGTYDGLNMYDSQNIFIYKPDINNQNSLSSNVIRNIIETDSVYLWISTKWGLNKLSQRSNAIEAYYNEYGENSYMAKDSHDNLFILSKPDVLSLYSKKDNSFIDLPVHKGMEHNTVSNMLIDEQDTIWINHQGVLERYTVDDAESSKPMIKRHSDFKHQQTIKYAFYHNRKIIIVDANGDVNYVTARGIHFVKNLKDIIDERGEIGSIIFDGEDILIGFKTNGLIRLDAANGYKMEKIEIDCGVFSLLKDEQQDIIWIGTDGQGIYALTRDEYTFSNLTLNQLPINKKRPVRAVYSDKRNSLWLGTKDNGIIRIDDYDTAQDYSKADVTHFTTLNGLTNNAVFAFAPSKKYPILWIASDGPELNYYSYSDNTIHTLENNTSTTIARVHSLRQTNDSLLWVGSGSRLLRISIEAAGNTIKAKDIRTVSTGESNSQQYNQIYSIYPENDSILLVGMRGNGVIRLNTHTEAYRKITFDKHGVAPMNDVLCIHQDEDKTIWIGSSYGLTRLILSPNGEYEYKNFNENEGLPNNTIHGIAEDHQGNLWLSSNTGIIFYNPSKNTFRNLNYKTGLKVIEFSDNAYYQDSVKNRCFFGGVDGVVWIENEENRKKEFTPDIYFTKLKIFNKDYSISEFIKKKGDENGIVLGHPQNFFAVSFVAVDYINGENSSYSYRLENFNDVWMNTHSNEAQFTNIPPGKYNLQVRYDGGISRNEVLTQSLPITILPPWYWSVGAKVVYVLLFLGSGFCIYRYVRWRFELKKASTDRRLKEKYKEEVYEGKLRFFTNITHEFCTPLTLIYGPCERILNYEHSDGFINKYTQIIKSNTERLNSLIQEVIDFRRMETGNQLFHIQDLNISEIADSIIASFDELAEQNSIRMEKDIASGVIWRSDRSGFTKILSNLISNAFKYTPENGTIRIGVYQKEDKLNILVYNTGKGISKEDIPLIFNRYSILDNIKENSIKGLSSRNGLGLSICQSMVELLQGTINVESEVNHYAEFIVALPMLETTEKAERVKRNDSPVINQDNYLKEQSESKSDDGKVGSEPKNAILIIDDNKELLWMLKDILSDEYSIMTAENGEEGMDLLKQSTPSLIITDIMMPKVDGITLAKQLKNNKHTAHIPLVFLSAKNSNDDKIEGIDTGADAYIPKPFSTQYLRSIIRQLIKKQEELKEYYNSSASAFDYSGGQLLQNEDKDFILNAVGIINDNMDNAEFGADELAAALQTSSRNLYRRFQQLNQSSPKDFIKEQRMKYAAKLLLTTTLNIQEIMYRIAATNRSHFYKEFAKRYNQTPREFREINKKKDDSLE